jgi:hypothetical protein
VTQKLGPVAERQFRGSKASTQARFKAACLDAMDTSQEGDQGGGKSRVAAAFSLWVGGGVVAGLTETAVRPSEVVLAPGSGVRPRSALVCRCFRPATY